MQYPLHKSSAFAALIVSLVCLFLTCSRDDVTSSGSRDTGVLEIRLVDSSSPVSTAAPDSTVAQKSTAYLVNELEVQVKDKNWELIKTVTIPLSEDGYFRATLELKAQDDLKIICIGHSPTGEIVRCGYDEDVDLKAGKKVTAVIENWDKPYTAPSTLQIEPNPSSGDYTVIWTAVENADRYTLQEASNRLFAGATDYADIDSLSKSFTGKPFGVYYYRVLAVNPYNIETGWSATDSVVVANLNYTLTMAMNPADGGVVIPDTGSHTYESDSVVPINATPMTGYRFVKWTGGVADSTNANTTVTVSTDKTITAVFERTHYSLTMAVSPTGSGTTTPAIGQHFYDVDAIAPLTAIPVSGWRFDHWSGGVADSTNAATSILMSEAQTVTAHYTSILNTYSINISSGDNQKEYIGYFLTSPLKVIIKDDEGIPVSGLPVHFSIIQGNGSLTESIVLTDSDGYAETKLQLGDEAGEYLVKAYIGEESLDKSVLFTEEAISLSIPKMTIVDGDMQDEDPGEQFETPLTVRLVFFDGVPASGVDVVFSITDGEGLLSENTCTTDSDGYASTTLHAGTTYGEISIDASVEIYDIMVEFKAYVSAAMRITFMSKRDGNWEIYTMNPDGSDQVNLTNHPGYDGRPAWSPDGSKIAFASDRDGEFGVYDIFVMNADGSGVRNVTQNSGSATSPAWSPDGHSIVYEYSGNGNLYIINQDGTDNMRLTVGNVSDSYPCWSPDGNTIVFSSMDGIYTVDKTGLNRTLLFSGFTNSSSWSPDGSQITFSTQGDIYIMDADGSNVHNISSPSYGEQNPSWSPDGKHIAFVSSSWQGVYSIYLMDIDGSNVRQLIPDSENARPNWSPIFNK